MAEMKLWHKQIVLKVDLLECMNSVLAPLYLSHSILLIKN